VFEKYAPGIVYSLKKKSTPGTHITSKTSYVTIASRRGGGRGKLVTPLFLRALGLGDPLFLNGRVIVRVRGVWHGVYIHGLPELLLGLAMPYHSTVGGLRPSYYPLGYGIPHAIHL
jgi:hypothetical protein